MKIKTYISNFLISTKEHLILVLIAPGLYPFLHYYNNNLSIADSSIQFLILFLLCFITPFVLYVIAKFLLKLKVFLIFRSSYLSILNICVFALLLGFLIFRFNKKELLLLLIVTAMLAFFLEKHLKKIVILELILASISVITLMPKLWFATHQNNNEWSNISKPMLDATFIYKPNIFVIQPDGYANSADLKNLPYTFDNSEFENWLEQRRFVVYDGFRSNYYSTFTSNASMFAMKHHYYSNTDKSILKTYNANDIIIGSDNNVLKILKNNDYKSYLITDNSYFLANRRSLYYDYCNVPKSKIHYFEPRNVLDIDLLSDFKNLLDTLSTTPNFFFIEKTIPGHINHNKNDTKGAEGERAVYLDNLKLANEWLINLVEDIHQFDADAMIVIVADHGGYVGFNYTLEVEERRLDSLETISAFSSMLSIKWPREVETSKLDFRSNVNLFHNLFYALSKDNTFIENRQLNTSYLPLLKNGSATYYECIDDDRHTVFKPIE